MKLILRSMAILLFLATVFSSCKNNAPKEAKYIPKTASVVLVLDPHSLQDKLQKGGISMDTLLKKVFHNDSLDTKDREKINELRTNAGINWNSRLYFFVSQKGNPADTRENVVNLMGSLSDAGKFEAFLQKQDELKNKEVKKESSYSYMVTGDGTMVAWNDQLVIATMYTHTEKPVFDTATMQFRKPPVVNREAAMKKEVDTYFTQKEDASLASVDVFTGMFKAKADGYAFTGSNSSLAALSMMPLQLPKLEDLLKDNYAATTLSFEDGRILAQSTTYTNKLLSGLLKEYAGPTVNLSLIEHYPSDRINGIMMASFNPEIFGGLLRQLEVEGLANGFLQKAGFTSQDLYRSLKGDIAVVVSDLGMLQPEPQLKKDESSMIRKKPAGKLIFNATVGDKASFMKLMDKAAEQGYVVKQGNTYKGGALLSVLGLYLAADEKNLVLASDSLTYTQYMANTGKAVISSDALNRFKGKSTVCYVDIASTLNGLMQEAHNSNYSHSVQTAKETFKDVIATSDNFDGTSIKAQIEVRMQNEKQNSLVTLTSLLTDIAADMQATGWRS
ncbi:MAG: hypothetical protein NVSMB63_19650 [Sediminibacterium sp.]